MSHEVASMSEVSGGGSFVGSPAEFKRGGGRGGAFQPCSIMHSSVPVSIACL